MATEPDGAVHHSTTIQACTQSADTTDCFGREVEAVSFNYLRREWNILDPALAEDFKQLEKVQDAEFSVVSETSDQRTWIVTFSKDNGPSASYIYNRCCFVYVITWDAHVLAAQQQRRQHAMYIHAADGKLKQANISSSNVCLLVWSCHQLLRCAWQWQLHLIIKG